MQILLIGTGGQLGWELNRTLRVLGDVAAFDYPEIDLEQPEMIRNLVQRKQPHLVVNAAAYTAVDKAETEQDRAWKVNAIAPGILAEEAEKLKAVCIHYSTDYVFNGQKRGPYVETDEPAPINFYGRSKLEGERLVQNSEGAYIILRTSWVYSLRQQSGFVNKVLQWARENETMRVVEDQIGSPTWARLLAELTTSLVARGGDQLYNFVKSKRGIYHAAGSGGVSRLEWARAIIRYDSHPEQQRAKKTGVGSKFRIPYPRNAPTTFRFEL